MFEEIVGTSPALKSVLLRISKVSPKLHRPILQCSSRVKKEQAVACPGQPEPSQSIGRIKLGRPFVIPFSYIRIFGGVPLKEVVPLQVGIERFQITCV